VKITRTCRRQKHSRPSSQKRRMDHPCRLCSGTRQRSGRSRLESVGLLMRHRPPARRHSTPALDDQPRLLDAHHIG
jgi:hypothetical protein